MNRAFTLLACLFVAACNSPTGVGNPCTVATDCERGQVCANEAGGYCTRGCTFDGNALECPAGSVCTTLGTSLYCADICTSAGDCRTNYECAATGSSTTKACKPIKK